MPDTTTHDMSTFDGIEARRAELVTEAKELIDTAGDTDLEGDELARYTEIEGDLEGLKVRKDRLERLHRHADAGGARPGDGTIGAGVQYQRHVDPYDIADRRLIGSEVKGRAVSAIEQTRHLPDSMKARATDLVEGIDQLDGRLARHIVATGRMAYRTGFQKLLAGENWAVTAEEQAAIAEVRAASLTDAAGGFAVPFTLDPTLILASDGTNNPMRQIARTVSIVTDSWNGVSTAGITASWDAEAAEVSDDTPVLTQPSIPVYKAQAFVPFSVEIGGDWAGMEGELRRAFADAKDRLEGAAFITGAGSTQPTGIVTALTGTASEISSTTTDVFAVGDLYRMIEATGPRYRMNGSWIANLGLINLARQFGTANSYSSFLTDLRGDSPPQLLGKPLYEVSDLDGTINATVDNRVAVFGDFSNYLIVDRVGMSVELVPHLFGTNRRPTGQRGFLAWWRVGADSVNDEAFTMLNVT